MKKIIYILIVLLLPVSFLKAQGVKKSKKELRIEKQEKRKQEVKEILFEKAFVFTPTHAMPLGGGSIQLNYTFDAEIKGDTLVSYLPFYGVAYHVDYGARTGGFDFTQPIENFELEEDEKGYVVKLEVKNKMDLLSFTFHISELGYATLNVTSTNRQAISYYGTIEADKE